MAFCISETFPNSSVQTNDRISIDGYNFIRADHPSDLKEGGVGIYYKEHLSLIKRVVYALDNCLVADIHLQGENYFLTCEVPRKVPRRCYDGA